MSIEIITKQDLFGDILLLIAGFGSTFFVLVPYIANLVIASRIKELIKHNAAAKSWFQGYTPIFTALVVLSGGCHAALSVVSSNVFGLRIFSCGITRYEMKRLGKIRIIGTVIVENIPQLICQGLYTVALTKSGQEMTTAVQAAFIASSLSIVASTLSYLIERDTSDTEVVQYHISFHKMPSSAMINEEEKRKLINNYGKRKALGRNIAETFGIPIKNIEVGNSMITKHGIITHIVHYIYQEDLEMLEEELIGQINFLSPRYFVSQLYLSLKQDINDAFCAHFDLKDDFGTSLDLKLGIKQRTRRSLQVPKSPIMSVTEQAVPHPMTYNRRETVLENIKSQIRIAAVNEEKESQRDLVRAIDAYCRNQGVKSVDDKKRCIMSLMDSMEGMSSLMSNYAIHGTSAVEIVSDEMPDILRCITVSKQMKLAFEVDDDLELTTVYE